MKLAEALLQDKPIKKKGMHYFYEPRVVNVGPNLRVSLKSIRHDVDRYLLNSMDFDSDDWEVKQEPMRVEFECEWLLSKRGFFYPNDVDERDILVEMYKSGKRFKVTCEEVVE